MAVNNFDSNSHYTFENIQVISLSNYIWFIIHIWHIWYKLVIKSLMPSLIISSSILYSGWWQQMNGSILRVMTITLVLIHYFIWLLDIDSSMIRTVMISVIINFIFGSIFISKCSVIVSYIEITNSHTLIAVL